MKRRVGPFMAVGALGFTVQIAALAMLTATGWPLLAATAVAVEAAILHNFCWHERWTWRDRAAGEHWTRRLVRFQAATGLASIAANVMITAGFVESLGLHPVIANTMAVAIMSAGNFFVADRWVFPGKAPLTLTLAVAGLLALAPRPSSAAPASGTLEAWSDYVARAELRMAREEPLPCSPQARPRGESLGVPGGTIHRWSGCTLVPQATVGAIVNGLLHPGTPPPQEDILESRVLTRSGDSLHVYLRLVRRTILTVVYDTEHDVTFSRPRPDFATSRSVATRIVESGESAGRDRGFLWKLNSYWRYIQTTEGVRIELESLSLSRDVPLLLRPVASPLVARVAGESIGRALDAVRTYFAAPRTG